MSVVTRAALARRSVVLVVLFLIGHADRAVAAECWRPPVPAPVVDPFREPACRWCRGNRGIDYGTCLLYTSPSPRDGLLSRMPSSA